MKLKGIYNPETPYSVGDVVLFTDNVVYHLQNPAKAGTAPVDTRYWGKLDQNLSEAVRMILDMEADDVQLENDLTQATAGKKALDAHQGKVLNEAIQTVDGRVTTMAGTIPTNISDTAILLKDASENEYLITVDASGDTPELVVTLVVPPVEETPSEDAGSGSES